MATPGNTDPVTIVLGPKDSALVIRDSGEEDVFTPAGNDDEFVPQSAVKILHAVMAIHDQETIDFIARRMARD